MLALLLKQPVHIWKQLGRWHRVEVILLTGLIFIYLLTRLHPRLEQAGANNMAAAGALYVYTLFLLASGAFILRYLLPRQRALPLFYTLPLDRSGLTELIGYYYFKYQLIFPLLLFPFTAALFLTGWPYGLLLSVCVLVFTPLIYFWHLYLFVRFRRGTLFFAINGVVWGLAFFSFPLLTADPFRFWSLYAGTALLGFPFLLRQWRRTDTPALEQLWPLNEPFYTSRLRWPLSVPGLPKTVNALLRKEALNLWRNPHYRRLKLLTLVVYIGLMIYCLFTDEAPRFDNMLLAGLLIIWLHYAQHFSEKYVLPEPEWFIHTTPLRFFPLWLAKMSVEFFFVCILLAVQYLFLWLGGAEATVQWNMFGLLLLFSLLVVGTMVNFRILFYDNPRLAGYAYHFTVVFFTVMSVNYRFVGPLVTLFMMTLIFYKTRKYFYA